VLFAGHGGAQLSAVDGHRPGDFVYRIVGEWLPERAWPGPDGCGDDCTHESIDTFASGAGRRVDVCLGCDRALRFWTE
jgi:hypothetical protein